MALHTTTLTAIRIELYLHTVLARHPSYLPSAPSAQHAALTPMRLLATPIDYHFTYLPEPALRLIRPNRYLLHLPNNTSASLLVHQPSRPPTTPDHPLHKTPAHSTASQPTCQPTQTPANPAVRSSPKNVPTKPPLPTSPSHHSQPQPTYPCPLSLFHNIKHSL